LTEHQWLFFAATAGLADYDAKAESVHYILSMIPSFIEAPAMPMQVDRRQFLGAAAGVMLLGGAEVWAQPAATERLEPKIQELLTPILKKHDLPALGAAMVKQEGLVAVGVVGVRKRGDETPVTIDDRFHLGSNTKALTATMLGRLVEEGALHWDASIGKIFPELEAEIPAALKAVTLEQLLSHRSGLPREFPNVRVWGEFAKAGPLREQRLAVLKRAAQETLSPAGEKMVYSNMNYVIAAAMGEQVTKQPWEDLLRDKLFAPLGINSFGFGPMGRPDRVEQPWPHHADGRPQPPVPQADNVPAMGPAGRVHLSLGDWARFVADQLRGAAGLKALLSPETYKKLHWSPSPRPFYTVGGWAGQSEPDLVLAHDGSNTMNYATALLLPRRNIAVLVVTNQGTVGGPGQKGCQEACDLLLRAFVTKSPTG